MYIHLKSLTTISGSTVRSQRSHHSSALHARRIVAVETNALR